jgi:hypothetical protein
MAQRKALIIVPGYGGTLKSPYMAAAIARPVLESEFRVFDGVQLNLYFLGSP